MDRSVDADARSSKAAFVGKAQQCFAVRAGADPLLDRAREAFCRVTEEVHQLADRYQQQGLAAWLRVGYSARRGFYLVVPAPGSKLRGGTAAAAGPLPADFIPLGPEPGARGGGGGISRHVTTHELNALNGRLADSAHDCMALSEQVLGGVVGVLRANIGVLGLLTDSIALLDLLCSFAATAAAAAGGYTRPVVSETGPLAIRKGRHPLLELCLPAGQLQPNDTYLHPSAPMHLISGPNMAGKSSYLRQARWGGVRPSRPISRMDAATPPGERNGANPGCAQVALLVVLAQAGGFVPAERMCLAPLTRLFTRMGTQDSIETNASTFAVETAEARGARPVRWGWGRGDGAGAKYSALLLPAARAACLHPAARGPQEPGPGGRAGQGHLGSRRRGHCLGRGGGSSGPWVSRCRQTWACQWDVRCPARSGAKPSRPGSACRQVSDPVRHPLHRAGGARTPLPGGPCMEPGSGARAAATRSRPGGGGGERAARRRGAHGVHLPAAGRRGGAIPTWLPPGPWSTTVLPLVQVSVPHYGLLLAEAAGMPPRVLQEARAVAEAVEQ